MTPPLQQAELGARAWSRGRCTRRFLCSTRLFIVAAVAVSSGSLAATLQLAVMASTGPLKFVTVPPARSGAGRPGLLVLLHGSGNFEQDGGAQRCQYHLHAGRWWWGGGGHALLGQPHGCSIPLQYHGNFLRPSGHLL